MIFIPDNMFYTQKPENFENDVHVVGCYAQYEGKLLMLLRHESKPYGNTWCVPGGKVDHNESLTQAVLRELKEETGIESQEEALEYFSTIYKVTPQANFSFHMFTLTLPYKFEIKIHEEEHIRYMWISPEESLNMNLIPDEDKCIKMIYNL